MSGVASLQGKSVQLIRRCFCRRELISPAAIFRPDSPADLYIGGGSTQIPASLQRGISSYVVLLPEVPPDSPETNAIMRLDQLPAFSEITPIDCVNGVAKLSIEFETELSLHTERLTQMPNTFESVRKACL